MDLCNRIAFQNNFLGQTFCVRVMLSGFMVDASNIMKFERNHEIEKESMSVEFWIFKPQKTGQQVQNN